MFSACIFPFIKQATNSYKDVVGREMNAPPHREGGVPRPAPRFGEGGFPRPVKMIKTVMKLQGKIKTRISTSSNRGNK